MLITFKNKHHADVVMFGDVAVIFLRAMGESETPPGILRGDEIAVAAKKLKEFLAGIPRQDDDAEDEQAAKHGEPPARKVHLSQRALPLLELLDRAYSKQSDVIWE